MPFLLFALCAAAPADGAERGHSVTDFDRISVEGPYSVVLETNRAPSATASGTPQALDAVSIDVVGRTLRVRANRSAWSSEPGKPAGPVAIRITSHDLRAATVSGSGSLSIDAVKAMRVDLALSGSGQMSVGTVTADQLIAGLVGSGRIRIGGNAKTARIDVRGSGDFDGAKLIVDDLKVGSETSGAIQLGAKRSAAVNSAGSGDVTILGKPACTVSARGAGRIVCGD